MAIFQKTHTMNMSSLDLADRPVELHYPPVELDSAKFVFTDIAASSDRCRQIKEMITECNFLLGLIDDEEQLLNALCRLIVESGGYCKASISLSDLQPSLARMDRAALDVTQPVTRDYYYASSQTGLIRSGIALPLRDRLSTFGALMLFSNEVDTYCEEEKYLLNQLVDNLARYLIARRGEFSADR